MTDTSFHKLRIADIRRETPDCVSIAFAVPDTLRPAFQYTPGQYLTLRATLDGAEQRRCYSICSGVDDGEWRVAIKHVPGGVFSGHANAALQVGDTLDVMPPSGRFVLPDGAGARQYLAIAAGSGITPILAIIKTALEREPDSRFTLLYGSRSTGQIIFRTALDDLKDRFLSRLTIVHVLSREKQDIPILHGHLDDARLRALLPGLADPATIDHAFLCGPNDMITTLAGTLQALGMPAAHIHMEHFTPSTPARATHNAPDAAAAPRALATIIHDGQTMTVPIGADETVLDAAIRGGLDLPWYCRGGMCCTCRAKLTDGAVSMDANYSLEPWETQAGFVLTCQSRPLTDRVTLDFDQV